MSAMLLAEICAEGVITEDLAENPPTNLSVYFISVWPHCCSLYQMQSLLLALVYSIGCCQLKRKMGSVAGQAGTFITTLYFLRVRHSTSLKDTATAAVQGHS